MSIKKKIIFLFSLSFAIIAIFAVSATIHFLRARKDINYLSISDNLRNTVLQIRREEKNFFLYNDFSKIEKIQKYFIDVDRLIQKIKELNMNNIYLLQLNFLKMRDYREKLYTIIDLAKEFRKEIERVKKTVNGDIFLLPIIEATFLEHPRQCIYIIYKLNKSHRIDESNKLILYLTRLESEIKQLRNMGEEIVDASQKLDEEARVRVNNILKLAQTGLLIFFPAAFLFGFISLFLVTHNIVERLNDLIVNIKKTSKGYFSTLPFPVGKDEVSILIRTYNNMAEALKQREMQLRKKDEELMHHKKLAAIGTLASGVAHELNNPLNNIHLAAQILKEEIGSEKENIIQETVNDILTQSLRVKKIVSDLLEFAREKPPEKQRVNLPDLIRNVYKQVENATPSNEIEFSLDSEKNVTVFVDPIQIERVFLNLFTNAIDAMAGKGRLVVKISSDQDVVKIDISDTGQGIPEESIEKIFDPFFTTKGKGTGLGLSIVYNIIKNHYGRIEVNSTQGKGTTFTIYLPRKI